MEALQQFVTISSIILVGGFIVSGLVFIAIIYSAVSLGNISESLTKISRELEKANSR